MMPAKGMASTGLLMAGTWIAALVGIAMKRLLPGRFDRLSIVLCIAIGWSIVIAHDAVFPALSPAAVVLLVTGGIICSAGVVFHLWRSLRFQTAIWHALVLIAAACHHFAVLDTVALAAA